MTDLILPGLLGGPALTIGLAVAVLSGSLFGGALVLAGVVLLSKGGAS